MIDRSGSIFRVNQDSLIVTTVTTIKVTPGAIDQNHDKRSTCAEHRESDEDATKRKTGRRIGHENRSGITAHNDLTGRFRVSDKLLAELNSASNR